MKAISSLTFPVVGNTDKLEAGELELDKGKALRGVFIKFSVDLANASGGNITLSDTQKQSYFGGWRCTASYGKNKRRKPYNAILLTTLQRIARFKQGADFEGYTNSTTGLGRTLTNGATVNVVYWVYVPTSAVWHNKRARKMMAMGRTQAKSLELEFKRESDTLPTGVTVSGTPSATVYPDTVDSKFDHWLYMAEYYEADETNKIARGPVGLHELAYEDTAILTATSLTNIEVRMAGKDPIYTGIDPNTAYIPTLQLNAFPSEADISDRATTLLQWTMDQPVEKVPVGRLEVEQITKNLTTFKLRGLCYPIPTEAEVNDDIQWASGKHGRNKVVKAINTAVLMGEELPEEYYGYAGFALVDSDMDEFSLYAGKVGSGDEARVETFVPDSVRDGAREMIASFELKGEKANAKQVYRKAALAVPAAIQDPWGFAKHGSPVLDAVVAHISG